MSLNKIPISEARIGGNLQTLSQVYRVNYMPEETIEGKKYDDKIELAILLEKEGLTAGAYRSIRFTNLMQLRSLIIALIRAYLYLGKQRKEITPENWLYKVNKFYDDIIKEVKNGQY